MKRLTLILFFIIHSDSVFTTPDQSNWGRFIYIGSNNENYFCYFILRNYPGTYYDYIDSVFVCKLNNGTGKVEEKKLINITIHKDTTTYDHWVHNTKITGFSVENYLLENEVWYDFPSKQLEDYSFNFENGNLCLKMDSAIFIISEKEKNLELLRSVIDNNKFYNISMFKEYYYFFNEQARVTEYYKKYNYYYFVACIGSGCIDSNYFQFVIPISIETIYQAEEDIRRKMIKDSIR